MNEDFYYNKVDNDSEDFINGFDHSGVDSGEFDDSCDYTEEDMSLGFINYIGTDMGGFNEYELIFTIYPNEFWGENFNYKPAGICNGLEPDKKYIQKVVKIKTLVNLDLIQNSGCFSMQDCMDGVVSLAYENLEGLEEYPPEGRLYFMFGESYDEVERKLAIKHVLINVL